jgi:hypothetical protein
VYRWKFEQHIDFSATVQQSAVRRYRNYRGVAPEDARQATSSQTLLLSSLRQSYGRQGGSEGSTVLIE